MKTKLILAVAVVLCIGTGLWLIGKRVHSTSNNHVDADIESSGAMKEEQHAEPMFNSPVTGQVSANDQNFVDGISVRVHSLLNPGEDYMKRISLLNKLPHNLKVDDREMVFSYLRHAPQKEDDASELAFKNLLMDKLCEMEPVPDGVSDLFIQMYQNQDLDVVLRDYAVQHLAACYLQLDFTGQSASQIKASIVEALWSALEIKDSSIAGTALLALNRLSQYRDSNHERFRSAALRLSADASAGELTRITGMQVSARLGAREVLPTLMQAAEAGESTSLRISAIGALGMLGDPKATELLTSVADGHEERLRTPAREALRRIELRNK